MLLDWEGGKSGLGWPLSVRWTLQGHSILGSLTSSPSFFYFSEGFCFVLLPFMVFPQGLYLYLAESYREKVVYAILSGPEVLLGDFVELGGTP